MANEIAKPTDLNPRVLYSPATDIVESKEAYHVIADVPGADASSVEVTVEKDELIISAKSQRASFADAERDRMEYKSGDYWRTFALSNDIDRSKIDASVANGTLHVTLPKLEVVKPRKIEVKAGYSAN